MQGKVFTGVFTQYERRVELELELDLSVDPSHPTDDIGEES